MIACKAGFTAYSLFGCLVIVTGFALLGSTQVRAEYNFTVLADSTDPQLGGVTGTVSSIGSPTLNANGVVAFCASVYVGNPPELPPFPVVVYTVDDDGITALTNPAGPLFPPHAAPGINAAGQVAFSAQYFDGATFLDMDVRRADPDGSIVRVMDSVIFDQLYGFPKLDGSGKAYFGNRGTVRDGIYGGDGTEVAFPDYTVIEEDTSGAPLPFFNFPTANEAGVVAYRRVRADGLEQLIRTSAGTPEVIAQQGDSISDQPGEILYWGGHIAISTSGEVAFSALLDTQVAGVFVADGSAIRTAADTASDGVVVYGIVGINSAGQVAFSGSRDDLYGLFIAGEGSPEIVMAEGTPFLDSVVTQISVAEPALNDAGQVAFTLSLLSGRQVLVRADPAVGVPMLGPAVWAALVTCLIAIGVGRIRPGRQLPTE